MATDLLELRERIESSRIEIADLADLVSEFSKANFRIIQSNTPNRNALDLYIMQLAPVPTRIKSKAGMIANELRACLDGLACALAVRHSGNSKDTYFPISKSIDIFNDDGKRKIRKMSAQDRDIVAGLKPYREGNPTLFGLHEADRTRKHIKLSGAGVTDTDILVGGALLKKGGGGGLMNCRINNIFIERMIFSNDMRIKDVNRLTPLVTGVPRELQIKAWADVAYAEPPELDGKGLVDTLSSFADEVSNIITLFD
ncbi:MAG: hypothetical protein JSR60_12890 [Proteobacteria bacterium]|nr:hypothetical protein [Pseudomonadota bacterium]